MNKINQKHQSIKFDFKFSKESIYFLDTLVYVNRPEQTSDHPVQKNNWLSKIFTCEIGTPVIT